ncbi:hypothetical protein CLTEP_27400 [Clostridium tepidiprofundi DSM 19306]|uniref:Helix-turn-helix domain protein n=1 Tax=Clostridium tepidiprofundi DSM 19306 TaxID=1121338 RepID=A0A151AMN8_9CLOT|nr:helix-turn-helix domain-containing protein [Clostridium tepidiprofundi]KYH28898.1 hypothetical protein CLTEP_27400 [Clostridium tepidiprofundi DSM 19306]
MPGFTFIDNDGVLDNEDLNIQEQSVLIALISYYNKEKGYAYPSYKQLKKRSKISDDRTLIKAIANLCSKDFIKKETLKGIGNKYYILTVKLQEQEKCSNSNSTGTPTVKLQGHPLENYSTTNTNTNTNTNINIDFEELWKLYPNKKGKAKARQIVTKLLKKYTKEELQRCIERYSKEVQGKDKQYILHGSTFFNGRYEDYLDNNYTEQNESFEEQKTKEAYAQLEYLKGEITFD